MYFSILDKITPPFVPFFFNVFAFFKGIPYKSSPWSSPFNPKPSIDLKNVPGLGGFLSFMLPWSGLRSGRWRQLIYAEKFSRRGGEVGKLWLWKKSWTSHVFIFFSGGLMGVDERCRVYSFFRILDSKLEPEVQFCLKVVLLDVWFSQETSWSYINRPWSWCEEVFFVGTVFCPCFCTSRPFQLVWKGICNQISWIEWRFTHCKWDLNPYTVDDIYIYICDDIYIYLWSQSHLFLALLYACLIIHHIYPHHILRQAQWHPWIPWACLNSATWFILSLGLIRTKHAVGVFQKSSNNHSKSLWFSSLCHIYI